MLPQQTKTMNGSMEQDRRFISGQISEDAPKEIIPGKDIEVKELRQKDDEEIQQYLDALADERNCFYFIETHKELESGEIVPKTLEEFKKDLRKKNMRSFVGLGYTKDPLEEKEPEKTPLGFISLETIKEAREDVKYVRKWVLPYELQGEGIGKKIFRRFLEFLHAENVREGRGKEINPLYAEFVLNVPDCLRAEHFFCEDFEFEYVRRTTKTAPVYLPPGVLLSWMKEGENPNGQIIDCSTVIVRCPDIDGLLIRLIKRDALKR